MKLSTKHIGKYVAIEWIDPSTYNRVELSEVKLSECNLSGKVIQVSPHLIIEHDRCDDLGDYTILHPALVTSAKLLK